MSRVNPIAKKKMMLPLKWAVSHMNYCMWIQMFFNVVFLREKSFRDAYSLISNVKLIFFHTCGNVTSNDIKAGNITRK